jgi:hypothetical protein
MPKFRVKGCFKENAEDVEIILEAVSYKDAERIANKKGILVSDVLVADESSEYNSRTPATLPLSPETIKEPMGKHSVSRRSELSPHRGSKILIYGICGILCGCFPLGIYGWLFANNDIRAMESGEMDSSGLWKTKLGRVLSIISIFYFALIIFISILSDRESKSSSNSNGTRSSVQIVQPMSYLYSITKDESMGNIKRSVDLSIEKPLTEKQLVAIAKEIKNSDTNEYERTFIGYVLADQTSSIYWATTHFNPLLQVNINGINLEDWEKSSDFSIPAEWDVIGKWLDLSPYSGGKIVIYIKSGKTYKHSTYLDGSIGNKKVVESSSRLGRRFDYVDGSQHGDYCIIDFKGNLQYWDDEGWIQTANAQ